MKVDITEEVRGEKRRPFFSFFLFYGEDRILFRGYRAPGIRRNYYLAVGDCMVEILLDELNIMLSYNPEEEVRLELSKRKAS